MTITAHQLELDGDKVWEDRNANGLQDAGESGLDGVTVRLYDASDTLVGATTTSGGGQYKFTGLTSGTYSLEFLPPQATRSALGTKAATTRATATRTLDSACNGRPPGQLPEHHC